MSTTITRGTEADSPTEHVQDNAIDILPVSFLNVFFGPGDVPSINLANVRGTFMVGRHCRKSTHLETSLDLQSHRQRDLPWN